MRPASIGRRAFVVGLAFSCWAASAAIPSAFAGGPRPGPGRIASKPDKPPPTHLVSTAGLPRRSCGAPPRPVLPLDGPVPRGGDCTLTSTTIRPEYDPGPRYEIPVVVHVITADDGVEGDLSNDLIRSQIAVLNEDFQAFPASPGGEGVDAGLSFALATVDPAGRPTDGITRTASSAWFADPKSEVFKQFLAWDPNRYLNIYTNDTEYLGYAYLPQDSAGEWWDGVVVHYQSFGRDSPAFPWDQGRTATHEVGHYLGLFHPFDGDPPEPSCPSPRPPGCYGDGDLVCDTPPDEAPHSGCPRGAVSCGFPAPIHNYMEYTVDRCLETFTAEQINRQRCSLSTYRPDLFRPGPLFADGFEYGLGRWSVVVVSP